MAQPRYLVVTAGGQGTRMGASLPKQFLQIEDRAILHITLEKFVRAVPGIRLITVLPKAHIPLWKDYCREHDVIFPQTVVEGGMTRFHSVRNALRKVPDGAVVAIHDGVRPLISIALIQKLFWAMETHRAVIPVVPCTDTLKLLRKNPDGTLSEADGPAPDRSAIWCAQTPQLFRSEDIKEAYREAYDTAFTDDASVAVRKGIPLTYMEGERLNLKITTPEDLTLAELLIAQRFSPSL